jgi:hypothetical protein
MADLGDALAAARRGDPRRIAATGVLAREVPALLAAVDDEPRAGNHGPVGRGDVTRRQRPIAATATHAVAGVAHILVGCLARAPL